MRRFSLGIFILPVLAGYFLALPLFPEKGGKTLRVGIPTFPIRLNPFYTSDEISQAVVNKVFDSLFGVGGSGRIRAGLVERFETDAAAKIITLFIKKGVFFSNGGELTAQDAAATITTAKDKRFGSPYRGALGFIAKTEVVGRYTLRLRVPRPAINWKSRLTIKILDKDELAVLKDTEEFDGEAFMDITFSGTGPYLVHHIEEPRKIVLRANPKSRGYRKGMFRVIEYLVVAHPLTAPLKLVTGELDICPIHPEMGNSYKNVGDWQRKFRLFTYRKLGYTYLVFNLRRPRVSKRVRRLCYNLLMCGDFLPRFLRGGGEPVTSPFGREKSPANPGRLKVHPGPKPVRLRIVTNSESKLRKSFVLFLREYLKKDGILLEPVFLEYRAFLQYLKTSKFDIAVSAYLMDPEPDMRELLGSDGYFNYAGFKHRGMDALLGRAVGEFDPVKRGAIYAKAYDIWLRELPFLPLFRLNYYMGVAGEIRVPPVTCTLMGSEGDFLYNISDWTTE